MDFLIGRCFLKSMSTAEICLIKPSSQIINQNLDSFWRCDLSLKSQRRDISVLKNSQSRVGAWRAINGLNGREGRTVHTSVALLLLALSMHASLGTPSLTPTMHCNGLPGKVFRPFDGLIG